MEPSRSTNMLHPRRKPNPHLPKLSKDAATGRCEDAGRCEDDTLRNPTKASKAKEAPPSQKLPKDPATERVQGPSVPTKRKSTRDQEALPEELVKFMHEMRVLTQKHSVDINSIMSALQKKPPLGMGMCQETKVKQETKAQQKPATKRGVPSKPPRGVLEQRRYQRREQQQAAATLIAATFRGHKQRQRQKESTLLARQDEKADAERKQQQQLRYQRWQMDMEMKRSQWEMEFEMEVEMKFQQMKMQFAMEVEMERERLEMEWQQEVERQRQQLTGSMGCEGCGEDEQMGATECSAASDGGRFEEVSNDSEDETHDSQ